MLKFLKGVVGSGGGIKDLPYNIGEPYSTAWGGWAHFRGTSKVDFVCSSFTARNIELFSCKWDSVFSSQCRSSQVRIGASTSVRNTCHLVARVGQSSEDVLWQDILSSSSF